MGSFMRTCVPKRIYLTESLRSIQMIASERIQVTELRNQGHSDRQLQEMGFSELSVHSPSVASLKA